MTKRPLNRIAAAILADWGPSAYTQQRKVFMFYCLPYVHAMLELQSISDMFGLDGAEWVVQKFLINSAQWQGEVARAIKLELQAHLKEKKSC